MYSAIKDEVKEQLRTDRITGMIMCEHSTGGEKTEVFFIRHFGRIKILDGMKQAFTFSKLAFV